MRVIQIGAGSFGRTWREGLSRLPELQVVGLVDADREVLEEARSHFGLAQEQCFTNPSLEWYEQLEGDFIIDSTPHALHYQNAIRAFRAGMDVIVVKPMSDAYGNACTMVREAEKRGQKLVVAQQIRFFPPCLKLRALIADGLIGDVCYASVDAFFRRRGPVREKWSQPYPLLVEAAIHHFDLIRWILGQDAEAVLADSWNMPWNDDVWGQKSACCIFRMANDARVVFRGLSTDQPGEAYPGTWVVEGTKGILRMQGGRISLDGEAIWPEQGQESPGLNLAALNAEVLRQAAAYLRGDGEISLSGSDNLKSLAMVFGAIESSERGCTSVLCDLG